MCGFGEGWSVPKGSRVIGLCSPVFLYMFFFYFSTRALYSLRGLVSTVTISIKNHKRSYITAPGVLECSNAVWFTGNKSSRAQLDDNVDGKSNGVTICQGEICAAAPIFANYSIGDRLVINYRCLEYQ